ITNFSAALSDNIGSFLYEHLFERHLDPLILVSAAFTALAFAFVPLLRLRDKRPGEPARALVTGDGSGHAWPGFAWAGNTQEHQNSTIQSDNVPVDETADLAAASGRRTVVTLSTIRRRAVRNPFSALASTTK